MFQKIEGRADQIDTSDGRTLPHLFEAGSGMRRFVTDRDLDFRGGYTRVAPGSGFKTFFWYDEFWVMLEGTTQAVAIDRPTGTRIEEKLNPHDIVFIPAGTSLSVTVADRPEDALLFFYIAIPASSKHAHWIGSMTPEDIEDVRRRGEHTPEGLAEEAKRGGPQS